MALSLTCCPAADEEICQKYRCRYFQGTATTESGGEVILCSYCQDEDDDKLPCVLCLTACNMCGWD